MYIAAYVVLFCDIPHIVIVFRRLHQIVCHFRNVYSGGLAPSYTADTNLYAFELYKAALNSLLLLCNNSLLIEIMILDSSRSRDLYNVTNLAI